MRTSRWMGLGGLLLLLVAGRSQASESMDALVAALPERFQTLGGRILLAKRLDAVADVERMKAAREALATTPATLRDPAFRAACAKRKDDVAAIERFLAHLGGRLVGESVMEADLRAFCRRPGSADVLHDAWIVGRGETGVLKLLVDHTRLGRALVRDPDDSWRLNKHAIWDLDDLLQDLERQRTRRVTLAAELGSSPRPEVVGEIVRRALEAAGGLEVDAPSALVARHFEAPDGHLVLRADAQAWLSSLDADLERENRDLEAQGAPVALTLDALAYEARHLDLLRSSVFYNPRTRTGGRLYQREFEDHFAARLFGLWGWNAKVSKDEADLVKRLRERKAGLLHLAKTHDKLIIHISGVPPWLSSTKDAGTFEGGGWENKQAHPPKDLAVWRRLIGELATMFRQVKDVERYYEFWNEPDLKYWQGSLDDFLALYAETAKTIRKLDPEAKIGGCAPNQWDGRIHKHAASGALNLELIRYAKKHDLPLDFVSWHHFGRPVADIAGAKAAYHAEWEKVGLPGEPEWLVTEWSSPMRGTPYANAPFAERMLGFYEAGVDVQTTACWEEFHARPDPKGFAPWGLMTQQGHRKSRWYVHRFFDRLVRDSEGVAVVRPGSDTAPTVVVSKKPGGVYDLMIWRNAGLPSDRLKAAWAGLQEAGFTRKEAARTYRVGDRMERAIAAGEPPTPRWAEAFAAAKTAYDEHPRQAERALLRLEGAKHVEVLAAESVRMGHAAIRVAVRGNVLAVPLAPQAVARLVIRIR